MWPREADKELIRNTSLARKESYIKRSTKQTNGKPHKKPMIFFQSWRPILHSFERKTFNVPSLITKPSDNCYTYAILFFIKRKLSNYDAWGSSDRARKSVIHWPLFIDDFLLCSVYMYWCIAILPFVLEYSILTNHQGSNSKENIPRHAGFHVFQFCILQDDYHWPERKKISKSLWKKESCHTQSV